jgi:hypothetical protein
MGILDNEAVPEPGLAVSPLVAWAMRPLTLFTVRLREQLNPDASVGDIGRVVDESVQSAYVLLRSVPGGTPCGRGHAGAAG